MEQWDLEGRDNFGHERWAVVLGLHASLKQLGIYYMDTRPGNIMFAEDEDEASETYL